DVHVISGKRRVGGVFAGYDIAAGNDFFGSEGKASLNDAEASYDDSVDTLGIRAKETFGLSARAGGMVNDSTGLYARIVWANTRFKVNLNGVTDSDDDDGLVLGAGLQTRLGANASLRVEYVRTAYHH